MNDPQFRIPVIDIMRGLAILAVVCGHCGIGGSFVYVFHIPAFIFVSGLLAHHPAKNMATLKNYVLKHIIRLYWPFVILQLCALGLHNLFFRFGWYGETTGWREASVKILKIATLGGREQLLGALWFLIALFEITILFDILVFIMNQAWRKKYQILLLLSVATLLCCVGYFFKLPRTLSVSLYLFPFYVLGALTRPYLEVLQDNKFLFLGIPAFAVVVCAAYAGREYMTRNHVFITIFCCVCGIVFCYTVSTVLSRSKIRDIFMLCGKYSFFIMVFHFVGFKIFTEGLIRFDVFQSINTISSPSLSDSGKCVRVGVYWIFCFRNIVLSALCVILEQIKTNVPKSDSIFNDAMVA